MLDNNVPVRLGGHQGHTIALFKMQDGSHWCKAFLRDRMVLTVWADNPTEAIDLCRAMVELRETKTKNIHMIKGMPVE